MTHAHLNNIVAALHIYKDKLLGCDEIMTSFETYLKSRDQILYEQIIDEGIIGDAIQNVTQWLSNKAQGVKDFFTTFVSSLKDQFGEFKIDVNYPRP